MFLKKNIEQKAE